MSSTKNKKITRAASTSAPEPRWHGWLRHGRGSVAASLRRMAGTAMGMNAAYVAYGLTHPRTLRALADGDAKRRLPGDDLITTVDQERTFGIDIDAPPEELWPWLMQLGYFRGGWYSWFPLDNGGYPSADEVYASLQGLDIGDAIPEGPDASSGFGLWRVVALDPPHFLVLFSRRMARSGRELAEREKVQGPVLERSWSFLVEPIDEGGSRLVMRVRAHLIGRPGLVGRLASRVRRAGGTVMGWTMLQGIKQRAERAAHTPARPEVPDAGWARTARTARTGANGKATRPRPL